VVCSASVTLKHESRRPTKFNYKISVQLWRNGKYVANVIEISVVGPLFLLTLLVNNVELGFLFMCDKIEQIRIYIFVRKV